MVLLKPDPEMPPGFIVQLPDGRPARTTLPVATSQVGCVIEFITGADGVIGCALITTFADAKEVHPEVFVTVKLYVPATRLPTV